MSRTDKFKTVSIRVLIQQPLREEAIAMNALLPRVLKRGTRSYSSTRAIMARLEELYGARLLGDVAKDGDRQLLVFGLDMVAGEFVPDGKHLLQNGIGLLYEVLTSPVVENGSFVPSSVEREKDNLTRQIRSLANDQKQLSMMRCVQEMFRGEPFGLHQLGTVDAVRRVDAAGLFRRYEDVTRGSPIDIFIVGDVSPEEITPLVEAVFDIPYGVRHPVPSPVAPPLKRKPREIFESQPTKQGKLTVGFRTGITLSDDLVHALAIFDGMLGGFTHSRFFSEIRQKEGLAYYAQSTLDTSKGLMMVIAGVDPSNRKKTVDLIMKHVDAVRRGDFTDEEMEMARRSLLYRMRASEDSVSAMTSIFYEHALAGVPRSLDERIKLLEAVDRDAVVEAGSRVQLDTIFFLGPEGRPGH